MINAAAIDAIMSAYGTKQTSISTLNMSAFNPKQTFASVNSMSAKCHKQTLSHHLPLL